MKEKAKELQCEHYCFWTLHTLLLMRKRCQSCGGLYQQPQARARTQQNTEFQCTRSAFISCHLSKGNLASIFNIQTWTFTWICGPCTEQTTVKYHTSLLVFYHRGETFPPPPKKRVNPSDLPHAVIQLFLISTFFFYFFFLLVCPTLNQKCRKTFFFLGFLACFPQRSARTMAEYTLSTTTHGQRSGTILGPRGETEAQMPANVYECA